MSADYEKLYKDLKEEYEQSKIDTDEIMKEYESTIKMLTDSAEKLKSERDNFELQLIDSNKKMKQLQNDLDNYKNKNIDKMKDIEILTTKNEKLTAEIQKINQNKSVIDSKIVTLENDNDHYLGKIRENEARIEDLNMKLESALEENISLQTDFETYKQMSEEQLIRKEQELKDAKNEIFNKDKIIARLNRRDSLNMKQIAQKIIVDKRKMSVPVNININTSFGSIHSSNNNSHTTPNSSRKDKDKLNRTWSTGAIITPVVGANKKLPEKFVEMYSKSCFAENSNIEENKKIAKKSKTMDKAPQVENKIDEAVDAESEDNNDSVESSSENKKEFDVIEVEQGEQFEVLSSLGGKNVNKGNDTKKRNSKQIADNLKRMLSRMQQRKSELLNYRKTINEKLEKIGVKII